MIISMNDMIQLLNDKRVGSVVLLTSMPADPIHPGHISCLQQMIPVYIESLGKNDKSHIITICVVNDDDFLIRKKGFAFIPLKDRCEIIDNIKCGPNYVVPFSPSNPMDMSVSEAIKLLKPNYFMKGGDRKADETLPEWEVCQKIGCKIIDGVGTEKIWSSSNYLKKYKELIIKESGL